MLRPRHLAGGKAVSSTASPPLRCAGSGRFVRDLAQPPSLEYPGSPLSHQTRVRSRRRAGLGRCPPSARPALTLFVDGFRGAQSRAGTQFSEPLPAAKRKPSRPRLVVAPETRALMASQRAAAPLCIVGIPRCRRLGRGVGSAHERNRVVNLREQADATLRTQVLSQAVAFVRSRCCGRRFNPVFLGLRRIESVAPVSDFASSVTQQPVARTLISPEAGRA
jgi:hypothetical protein